MPQSELMKEDKLDLLKNNPLMVRNGLPPFDLIKAEHVVPAMNETLNQMEKELRSIENNIIPTWEGLCQPLEALDIPFEYTWGVINHLTSVKNSEELRKAYQEILPKVINFSLRMSQSKLIYEGLKALRNSPEFKKLNDAKKRIVEKKILSAELAGVGLEGETKKRFNEIENRLSQLSTDFSNNVLDATKAYELIITDKKDTEGWPANLKNLAAQSWAKEKNGKADPENGPWRITLDYPVSGPFLQHSRNREQRKEVYIAMVSKASEGKFNNTPLIDEILKLRNEKASILGFKTFADLSLATKMAPNVASVWKMSEELANSSREFSIKDHKELEQIAKEMGLHDELQHWDVAFYSERLREKLFDYTDEQLRPYFPLDRVLNGLFNLANKLFGIEIKQSNGNFPKWNEDVQFFDVLNEKKELIANFYLDPYSRPSEKNGGAWMNECFGRRIRDGKVRNPVIYLVCNGTPPTGNIPSLMSFRDVLTLFHEFGHGLQGMLTTVDEAEAAGINGIEWDAVELASQFMENWCYHKPTLLGMAKHYETGETLPEELFNKIKASKNFRSGTAMMRQLELLSIDMYLHSEFDPAGNEKPLEVARRFANQYRVMPPNEKERFLCSFSHIFAGGYCAGYYSYKWAEVLSADAFAAFEEAGLDNEEKVQELGRKFRDTILSLGGSKHPSEVYRMFRGKDASTEALLRHSGLK
ncbi:MAG: M3 family metallopeptidase [Candidatus Rifleibacteriota bacterium]